MLERRRELRFYKELRLGVLVRDEGGRRFKSCHSDQYLGDPQIPFPTVSPTDISFYVVVLHDAAKGAVRLRAFDGKGHEIESAADFLAKYWQIVTAFQTARMSAQSLSYEPMTLNQRVQGSSPCAPTTKKFSP